MERSILSELEAGKPLSTRQRDVLLLAARGMTATQASEELDIRRNTVNTHLIRAYARLYSHSNLEAVLKGVQSGDLTPEEVLNEIPTEKILELSLPQMDIFEALGYGLSTVEVANKLQLSNALVLQRIGEIEEQTGITSTTQIGLASSLLFEPESLIG